MDTLLSVQEIHTYYGDSYVLQGMSVELNAGEALGILGRNGMGKTTLVNSIMGFVPPRGGKIIFKDKEITKTSSYEISDIGIVLCPQGRRIFQTLSLRENLIVAAQKKGAARCYTDAIYQLFPRLGERKSQQAGSLSGGEQQMLAVGRALMTNPDCLILDEPSEGLAPLIIQDLGNAIRSLKEEGLSILLVEQNAPFAIKTVDRVNVIEKGKVVLDTSPEELWNNEQVKKQYLGIG